MMNSTIRAIAFDLDGLMVNSEDIYDEVCDQLLKRRGSSFDLELKLKMMGRPGAVAIEIMKRERGLKDPIDDLKKEVEFDFHRLMPERIQPLFGLMKLLDFVETQGLPKCVATSSYLKHATAVLEACEIADRFDFVLTSEDVVNGKPAPEVYLLAAQRHGVDPTELMVFEDSVTGSQAGVAAGAKVVAVPGRHSVNCDYSHVEHVAKSLDDPLIYGLFQQSVQADTD